MARQALATAVILLAQFTLVFGISGMPIGLAMLYPVGAGHTLKKANLQ